MDGSVLSTLGQDFAGASLVQKVQLIDAAIARVMTSQESETNSNRNKRADLDKLLAARTYYNHLAIFATNPSQLVVGILERR